MEKYTDFIKEKEKSERDSKLFFGAFLISLFVTPEIMIGSTKMNLATMLANTHGLWYTIMTAVAYASVLIGAVFILMGLHSFILISQNKAEPKKAVFTLISGAFLVSLGVNGGLLTGIEATIYDAVGGDVRTGLCPDCGNAFSIVPQHAKESEFGKMGAAYSSLISLLRLVGVIAIVRGLLILKKLGDGQQGSFAAVVYHIFFGGLLLQAEKLGLMVLETVGAKI